MSDRIQVLGFLLLLGTATGCVTTPPPAGNASAYSVGDQGHVAFDEIVVSLPLRGANVPYQNLHVAPAIVVNARKTTFSRPHEAEQIMRRLENRVAARVTETLSGLGEQSISETATLRRKVVAEAQSVAEEALAQWEHGADYRVEVVIASWYWTDASVGRSPPRRGGWW